MKNYRYVAFCGVFTALAMIFSYIEALIPIPLGIPGAKLGFANICIIVVLYMANARAALFVDVLRILLTGMLFGNMSTFIYSIAGGLLSVIVMIAAKKLGLLSMMGVSMAGGVSHNLGQLLCAILVMETTGLGWYLPVLLVVGVVTGVVNGIVGRMIFDTLKKYSSHDIV